MDDGELLSDATEVMASDEEPEPDPETAPYGWTRDKKAPSGWRPKKRPGRGGRKRAPDEEGQADDGERDPEPSWHERLPKGRSFQASPEQQADVAAMLALFYSLPGDFLMQVDPYCFGALNANFQAVVDATVPIICRSENLVRFATGGSGMILWIQLMAAIKPIAVAVFQHHVIHSVELLENEETGEVVVSHTDFSAYSAS
jgi:hypothetical protein